MNPYYYLFYWLSRHLNKKRDNALGPIFATTTFVVMNVAVVLSSTFPIAPEDYHGWYKYREYALVVIIVGGNLIWFANKKRVRNIMDRYKGESKRSRIVGGILVILYAVLSLALLLFSRQLFT